MGIKDLLRFMKPHIEPIHIKKYAGKRVIILPGLLLVIFFPFVPVFRLYLFQKNVFFTNNLQVGIDAYSWLHKGGSIF